MAGIALLLFAGALAASAVLKTLDPHPAAHALEWLGLGHAARVRLVDALSVFEACLSAALLCGLWTRLTLRSATVACVLLLVGHVASSIGGGERCGCFGGLDVPDGWTYALLLLGLSGSLAARVRTRPRSIYRRTFVALSSAAAIVPMWMRATSDIERPEVAISRAIGVERVQGDDIVLIGSWSCDDCREAVREIETLRLTEPGYGKLRLHVVVRQSDAGGRKPIERSWIRGYRVSDHLWWAATHGAPPTFLRATVGAGLRITRTWR